MTAIEKNPARLARVGRSERGESSSSKFISNPRLPEALQEFAPKKVWVGMEISHEENGKISKRPVNPHLNELAKSNDNSTWGTFDEANIALSTYQFDRWATYRPQYLAIALSPSLNLICVDLDNVIDKETGEVNQEALKIVERLNSYTEISTSGTGLHIYLKAQKKTAKTNRSLFSSKGSKIEIFDNRFILITNQTWGERKPLREAQEDLDAICHEYFKEAEEAPLDESSHTSPEMTDEEVIEKASKANRVGEKFKRLFEEGDTSEYAGDDSAADFALLCLLAYWTQNPDQIERIFSRSILGQREKWTKRSDYRKRSIKEALKKVKKTYQASKRKEQPVPDHAILVEPGNIHLAVDAAEEILIKHDCGIFQRHGRLVRIVKVGSLATPKSSSIRRPDNAMVVVEVDPIYLTEVLTKLGCWARFDIRTNGPKAIDCPERIAKHLLARRQWKIPHLTGIIYAPTLRADGSILQTPGYDPMSGLFYDPGSYAFEQIPEGPTQEEAKKALNVFLKLIEYFPFEDNASRSVSLSSFLTGLIRKSLRTAPFHGFTAPKMGSGKTLLASLVAYIVTGNELVVLPPADDEKEEKKRILSVLMDGDPIVCYDNIERPFGSAALCAVLTQEQYKDRLLGETTSITVSTNSTFLGTGNNLQ